MKRWLPRTVTVDFKSRYKARYLLHVLVVKCKLTTALPEVVVVDIWFGQLIVLLKGALQFDEEGSCRHLSLTPGSKMKLQDFDICAEYGHCQLCFTAYSQHLLCLSLNDY
jgi:hypothetical protein